MAVVLKASKLIFTGQPRTGSRSATVWLQSQLGGICAAGVFLHATRCNMQQAISAGTAPEWSFLDGILDEYEAFCIVRNPCDIVVTYYLHHLASAVKDKGMSFLDFLKTLHERPKQKSQVRGAWHLDMLKDVEYILQYEHGYPQVLFDFLQNRGIDITAKMKAAFPMEGKSKDKKPWQTYYCNESREIVTRLYGIYMRKFGYGFD